MQNNDAWADSGMAQDTAHPVGSHGAGLAEGRPPDQGAYDTWPHRRGVGPADHRRAAP